MLIPSIEQEGWRWSGSTAVAGEDREWLDGQDFGQVRQREHPAVAVSDYRSQGVVDALPTKTVQQGENRYAAQPLAFAPESGESGSFVARRASAGTSISAPWETYLASTTSIGSPGRQPASAASPRSGPAPTSTRTGTTPAGSTPRRVMSPSGPVR